jgi:hypothetical protein
MGWRHSQSPVPKNTECKNPLENFSPALTFWDKDGILLIDCFPKGQTTNVVYFSYLLVHLKDILKKKYRGKLIKSVLFLHDILPSHRALETRGIWLTWASSILFLILFSGFGPVGIPPVPGLKKLLKVYHFSSDTKVIVAA